MILKSLSALVLLGATVTGVATFATPLQEVEEKSMVQTADAPQLVRDSIAKLQPGVKFAELEVEQENGAKLYKGAWKKDGMEHEIAVDAAGSLVEIETKMTAATVPAAVAAAAKKAFPKGVLEFEKKEMVFYEVEVTVDGKERELLLSPSGQPMEIENEAMDDDDEDDDNDEDEDEDDDVDHEDED